MLDPRSPYSRRMWHYDSDRQLTVAQIMALGSVDARTAALLWVLIERHTSLIVSGPTDPTPGVGKTTTLNALLDFLPNGTTLVYTLGMYEDFSFTTSVDAQTTVVLANEVSDHLRIYMWGRTARTLLDLPGQGYAVATSCHADEVSDVLTMLRSDLRIPLATIQTLGVVVNIGLAGSVWPPSRRFLSVNYIHPTKADPANPGRPCLLPLATWEPVTDTQQTADDATLRELATCLGMTYDELVIAVERREARLTELAAGKGASRRVFREAVESLIRDDQPETEDAGSPMPGDRHSTSGQTDSAPPQTDRPAS
jgi:hypothetical protein